MKSNFIGASIVPSNGNLSDGSSNGTYSGISSPSEIEKGSDNVKLLPMSTKASSEESSIEYGKRFLPPLWVDIQEEIERHIEEIEKKSTSFLCCLTLSRSRGEEVPAKETEGEFCG